MKVMIFTMRTSGNIFMVNRLTDALNTVGMVILNSKAKTKKQVWDLWHRRARRHGYLTALNRLLFVKFSNRIPDSKILEFFFQTNLEIDDYTYKAEVLNTYNINSNEVSEFIKERSPDLIAVCGSNIIKPEIFNLPPKGTINIHTGITPDYRCANPVEWALYNKDFDKVGVTIHFVNEGLDTGDIIYQKTAEIEKGDTVQSLYCKNIINGTDLMIEAIKGLEAGTVTAKTQDTSQGKHYLSIKYGIMQDLRVKKILKAIE